MGTWDKSDATWDAYILATHATNEAWHAAWAAYQDNRLEEYHILLAAYQLLVKRGDAAWDTHIEQRRQDNEENTRQIAELRASIDRLEQLDARLDDMGD